MKKGDTVITQIEIISMSGLILFEKGEKVVISKVHKSSERWRKDGTFIPEKITWLEFKGKNSQWGPDNFNPITTK